MMKQEREAQRALVYDDGGAAHYSQEEEADGLHPFPDSEAALELLAVKALPGLTGAECALLVCIVFDLSHHR